MHGVRALLNIGNDGDDDNGESNPGDHIVELTDPTSESPSKPSTGSCNTTPVAFALATAADSGAGVLPKTQNLSYENVIENAEDGEVASAIAVRGDARNGNGDDGDSSSNRSASIGVITHGTADSEDEDGPDPWGEGKGESAWGKRSGLALIEALGVWCASVSAYDRLAHPTPDSAAGRAAEAETEWDELEMRIARARLDVQLMEFRWAFGTEGGGRAYPCLAYVVRFSVVSRGYM